MPLVTNHNTNPHFTRLVYFNTMVVMKNVCFCFFGVVLQGICLMAVVIALQKNSLSTSMRQALRWPSNGWN